MQGWDEDGEIAELADWQADAVRQLCGPGEIHITERGNIYTWGDVIATAARLMADCCVEIRSEHRKKQRPCPHRGDTPCQKNLAGMVAWYCARL